MSHVHSVPRVSDNDVVISARRRLARQPVPRVPTDRRTARITSHSTGLPSYSSRSRLLGRGLSRVIVQHR